MPILGAQSAGTKGAPSAPTIGTATNVGSGRAHNNGAATVTFTAPTSKLPITSYTVTSSPGGYTASGASSPLTVTGLQSATAYTFTVRATSAAGLSPASSASNSITATTVPQAPTIGAVTVTNTTTVSIPFTAGATGGTAISSYTITSSPSIALSYSGTSTPFTVTGSFASNQAYTFSMTATNANGTSTASSASNSVTPLKVYSIGETGPGGGKVFYDAGSTLSWGRYLEVAVAPSWNDGFTYGWGNFETLVGTSAAIGTGLANSNAAVALTNESYRAIGACRTFGGGGKSDWFLPSKDELNALSARIAAVGGANGEFYWSSTEVNATNAWYQNLNTGGQYSYVKTFSYYVRPVRAF